MSDGELPVYEFEDYRVDAGNLLLSRAGGPVPLPLRCLTHCFCW